MRKERYRNSHRSEEHTSELQSPCNLVCRLLLEKKKTDRPLLDDALALLDDHAASGAGVQCLREVVEVVRLLLDADIARVVFRVFFFKGHGDPGVSPLSPPPPLSI